MRRTRILATLGPASDTPALLAEILDAGADAVRLNFSHGTAADHAAVCRRVREAAAAAGREVAVLQDLGGPKIRVGPLATPFTLAPGDTLTLEHGDFPGEPGRVSCRFDALFASVRAGERLLIDDGRVELRVTEVAGGRLRASVVIGGTVSARKGVNLPDTLIQTPALTPKDEADLHAGVAMGVDLVALSFVQSADDVRAARAAAVAAGAPHLPIVAKIERPQAVERIDEILEVADGLMVARGDLGIELPLETVPAVQKRLVAAARRRGVPVIVATEVLESMRTESRPTRAEVTDAAHAVDERADAIMLSGETAVGRHPVRAVRTLDAIVREAEKALGPAEPAEQFAGHDHGWALAEAAVALAERTPADAIVAVTEAGKTARMLAALRPRAAIIAATKHAHTAARLSITWGVRPLRTESRTIPAVRDLLVGRGLVPAGSAVVFVSMHPVLGGEDTNFVHVQRL